MTRRVPPVMLPGAALLFILAGLFLRLQPDLSGWSRSVWMAGLVLTGAPVVWRTLRGLLRGRAAADIVATLAIAAAIPLGEPLAGLVVVLMQTGGEALERFAEGRASAAVRELEAAAPHEAHRLLAGGAVEDISADEVAIDDLLLVRPGEMVPCDAVVTSGASHVDVSRLTGEPVPVSAGPGTRLPSGSVNGESPLTLRVEALASQSLYARIVELVRSAQASKAPLQRLADRYAIWFTPLTLAVCVVAYLVSSDPVRVLAVLVVATPCPLILATPVAIIGGLNRAARQQIVIRNGGALEQLGGATVAMFDKTGTLTVGRPALARVVPVAPFTEAELLALAGAVEHGSGHLLARSVVDGALARGVGLPAATDIREAPGEGVEGRVGGRLVIVGAMEFVRRRAPGSVATLVGADSDRAALRAYVAVDGSAAGFLEFADAIRPEAALLLRRLRGLGITRMALLSGDRRQNVEALGAELGFTETHADLLPDEKVALIKSAMASGQTVVMVGDGTNDAPALSTATVGIALASHGGGISAEAADIVILADDLGRVADAVETSRWTMRIARQSIWAGLGMSGAAMLVAAAGYIPPIAGAVLQEVIDIAVILNALRAAAPAPVLPPQPMV
ncbi:MAG: heavy metal translocating P-type ATPase [Gemmatimonadales bacterium]|nr:MAG: heavy metal translocating P-type ATPase [Gemmatimonadales bacterium]